MTTTHSSISASPAKAIISTELTPKIEDVLVPTQLPDYTGLGRYELINVFVTTSTGFLNKFLTYSVTPTSSNRLHDPGLSERSWKGIALASIKEIF